MATPTRTIKMTTLVTVPTVIPVTRVTMLSTAMTITMTISSLTTIISTSSSSVYFFFIIFFFLFIITLFLTTIGQIRQDRFHLLKEDEGENAHFHFHVCVIDGGFDPADPEPIPEFEFDQSLPD